jgi:hypothetical protein
MKTFKASIVLRLILVITCLILTGVFVAIAATTPGARAVLFPFAGFSGAAALAAWFILGRAHVDVDEKSVTYTGALSRVTRLNFDEVSDYRYKTFAVNGVDQTELVLFAADGRKIKINTQISDLYALIQLLVEGVEAQLKAPGFGPLTLDESALAYKDKRVPLAEISAVTFDGVRLRVKQKDKLLAAIALPGMKVPNLFLFLDALRARGVSAPDARPWRAVVNAAGFQIPKS